jgi:hypothetical protein
MAAEIAIDPTITLVAVGCRSVKLLRLEQPVRASRARTEIPLFTFDLPRCRDWSVERDVTLPV